MRSTYLISAVICMPISMQANGRDTGPIRFAEEAQETNTSAMTLPASDSGTLYFNNCSACNQQQLKLTPAVKFFLNDEEVTFSVFKTAYEANTGQQVTVCFKPDTHAITRVILYPIAVARKR